MAEKMFVAEFSRTSLSLPTADLNLVKKLAEEHSTSISEIVRRAVQLEVLLAEAMKNGEKLMLMDPKDPENGLREIILR